MFTEEPIIDDSEDEEPDEAELKRRKAHEAEINEHAHIIREAEEKEKNTQDSQLDLPITQKAFRFRAFIKITNVPFSDITADQMLSAFYLKHMKPQYKTWSVSKIIVVKVTRPIQNESFPNVGFNVARGSSSQACEFTLADLPCLNPRDWMVIYNILVRNKEKYEPVVSHLQLLIKSYIQEVGSMDVEIATVVRQKPSVVRKYVPKDIEKLNPGNIFKECWFIVYASRDR
ncbi:unnamed protein product [Lactuca saligna]|uniref:Uncharacterized protein n=1 Tax=Lactuca saligna TaxID=75948 RepID=A0AA35YX60_LACSI|nr:unnamed protein product [Lactuca saligna]